MSTNNKDGRPRSPRSLEIESEVLGLAMIGWPMSNGDICKKYGVRPSFAAVIIKSILTCEDFEVLMRDQPDGGKGRPNQVLAYRPDGLRWLHKHYPVSAGPDLILRVLSELHNEGRIYYPQEHIVAAARRFEGFGIKPWSTDHINEALAVHSPTHEATINNGFIEFYGFMNDRARLLITVSEDELVERLAEHEVRSAKVAGIFIH